MLNLHEKHTNTLLASDLEAAAVGHIVVLISSPGADFVSITRKVWNLAQASGAPIRLIGLCHDKTHEPAIRRTLVTMAAMLNDGSLPVSMEVLVGADWLQRVKFHFGSRDIVVCWDESASGAWIKPFSQLLKTRLEVPLYVLSTQRPVHNSRTNLAKAVGAWVGFLTIIIGFLLLQVKIYQLANLWTITLEILSTACEFWLIWFWNRLFQ